MEDLDDFLRVMGTSLWLEFLCDVFLDVDLGFFFCSVSTFMKLFRCSTLGDFSRVLGLSSGMTSFMRRRTGK